MILFDVYKSYYGLFDNTSGCRLSLIFRYMFLLPSSKQNALVIIVVDKILIITTPIDCLL